MRSSASATSTLRTANSRATRPRSVARHVRASTDTPLHCALQNGHDVSFHHNSPNTAVLDGNEFATPSGAVLKAYDATGDITSGGSCPANRNDVSMCTAMTIDGSPGAGDNVYNCLSCTCAAGEEGTVEPRVYSASRVIYSLTRVKDIPTISR